MTRFTELTGCRVPVQQAPMGSVSTSALAVAVADTGGVGSITTLGMSAAQVDTCWPAWRPGRPGCWPRTS
jgi:nitronate monooxygenase